MNINSDLSSKVGFTHQLWAFQVANLTALKLSLTRENRDHDTHTAGWLPEITRSVPSIRAGLRGEPVRQLPRVPSLQGSQTTLEIQGEEENHVWNSAKGQLDVLLSRTTCNGVVGGPQKSRLE